MTEAFEKLENNYISDILRLTENYNGEIGGLRSQDAELKTIKESLKENSDKVKSLTTLLETTQAELQSGKDKLNEVTKLLEGKTTELVTKETELKESYEEKLKETRVNVLAKIGGLTLDKATLSSLKECKSDDELLVKLEEHRGRIVKSLLRENLSNEVTVNKVSKPKVQSALMERFDKVMGIK